MTDVCKCGRGKVSKYDTKCGHCRTSKQQKIHQHKLLNNLYLPNYLPIKCDRNAPARYLDRSN